jgi:hypothetical protein
MVPRHANDIAVVSMVVRGMLLYLSVGMGLPVPMSILSLVIVTLVLKVMVERAVFVRKRAQGGEQVDG